MHILLVEDETHVRIALALSLSALGYVVTEAPTAREASMAISRACPDVAIIDINLPDGTGWDVLQILRGRSCTETRSIVMSAIPPRTQRLAQFAPFGVLLKPFPFESLKHLIQQVPDEHTQENEVPHA